MWRWFAYRQLAKTGGDYDTSISIMKSTVILNQTGSIDEVQVALTTHLNAHL